MFDRSGEQFVADLLPAKALVNLGMVDRKSRITFSLVRHFGETFAVYAQDKRAAPAFFDLFNFHLVSSVNLNRRTKQILCARARLNYALSIMKMRKLAFVVAVMAGSVASAFGQGSVVVSDPTKGTEPAKLSAADQAIFDTAMPAVKAKIPKETCEPEIEVAGYAAGAFTKAGAKQKLVFYQYCQTGNGFGWAGLVLIEGGKVAGSYISEAGWTGDINAVADINQNGLDEFALAYSGGLHQGQGGTGVDVMEFSDGLPKGIGWYKAEEFGPTEASTAWKLTAKPGATPIFYKQKFFSGEGSKYKRVGAAVVTKLTKVFTSKFSAVK